MKLILYPLMILGLYSCTNKEKPNDETAVMKIVLDFQADFNDGTFKKAESYATSDWVHINPGGGMAKGREPVLNGVRTVHQWFLKGITMTTDSMDVRFIKPDVAIVTAYHTMDDYMTPDSTKHINERQIKSYVVLLQDGKWMMTLDHNTIIQQQ